MWNWFWPRVGPREVKLGGEEEERLLLGAKGYGREGRWPEGGVVESPERNGVWGPHVVGCLWARSLGRPWNFSMLQNILRMSPRHTANISFFYWKQYR